MFTKLAEMQQNQQQQQQPRAEQQQQPQPRAEQQQAAPARYPPSRLAAPLVFSISLPWRP